MSEDCEKVRSEALDHSRRLPGSVDDKIRAARVFAEFLAGGAVGVIGCDRSTALGWALNDALGKADGCDAIDAAEVVTLAARYDAYIKTGA